MACTRQGAEVWPSFPVGGQSLRRALQVKPSVVRALVVATVREGSLLEQSEPTRCPSGRTRVAVQHPSRGRGGRVVSHGPFVHPWPPGRAATSLGQRGKRQERKERVVASNKPVLVGWVVVSHWLGVGPASEPGLRCIAPSLASGLRTWHPAPKTASKRGRFLLWST